MINWIEYDPENLRVVVERARVVAERVGSALKTLHDLPDPVGALGDGSDALGRSGVRAYQDLGGSETIDGLDLSLKVLGEMVSSLDETAALVDRTERETTHQASLLRRRLAE